MSNNIIKPQLTTDSSCLTLPVKQTVLLDEHLRTLLSAVYEKGFDEAQGAKLRSLGTVLWSISGTLFLACLTTTFNDYSEAFAFATQARLTACAWLFVGITFVGGLIAVGISVRRHDTNVFTKRNHAVEQVLADIKQKTTIEQD